MVKTLSAVYENGVLRPLASLPLKEHQYVRVTVSDWSDDRADAWLDHESMASVNAIHEPEPTLEEVRRILSKTPGNLSDDIRAERDSRG
jgi:predicted DNA-binding antitoxin AbrB/MazE fold protein